MSLDQVPIDLPFNITKIARKGERLKYIAEDKEFDKIAQYLDVVGVDSFKANLQIMPWRKGGVKVEGHIVAQLRQTCSVSLEAMKTNIDHQFQQWFVHQGSRLAQPTLNEEGEIVIDLENPELPDTYENDSIEFGAVILEQAILAIDPYPRMEGAEFTPINAIKNNDEDAEQKEASPFAILEQLKHTDKKGS